MPTVSIQFEPQDRTPRYVRIAESIRQAILRGELAPAAQLPAIRTLAAQLSVSNATVVAAYRSLQQEGLARAVRGGGYYVCAAPEAAGGHEVELPPGGIAFGTTTPEAGLFPIQPFKQALDAVLDRDGGAAFGYQDSNGYAPLRASLAALTEQEAGCRLQPEDIQIVSGAQQGIDIVGKALLHPGDVVLTETPTYAGALAVFRSRGAKVVGVPMEGDGIHLGLLEQQLRAQRPKLVYVMTSFQNPTTVCYTPDKQAALLRLCRRYGAWVLEDDSMSGLNFDPGRAIRPLKALDPDNQGALYLRSFSKLLMPGLRVGYLVAPEILAPSLRRAKHLSDISSSSLLQRALDVYFREGGWQQHLAALRAAYEHKYRVMAEGLRALRPYGLTFTDPKGGLNFWLHLPQKVTDAALYEACLARGVSIMPGKLFYVEPVANEHAVRLSYAATPPEDIRAGLARLSQALSALLGPHPGTPEP